MKAVDLRGKTIEELDKEADRLREEIFKLRMRKGFEQIDNPRAIRNLRKDLARVLTVKNEKLKEEKKNE